MSRKIIPGDTVKIIAVGQHDALYRRRKDVVGVIGTVKDISPNIVFKGWKCLTFVLGSMSTKECEVYYQIKVTLIKDKETNNAS